MNGILMYTFHEDFYAGLWDVKFVNLLIDCSYIAPLTPVVFVIRGFVFQPLFCMALIKGSYLACFCVMACFGNLSWQYVNSMNCSVCVRVVRVWGCGLGLLVCRGCLGLAWRYIGILFACMCTLRAIQGRFVLVYYCWDCLRLLMCSIWCVCWL